MRPLEAAAVKEAVDLLSRAERPLIIVGKDAAAFSKGADSLIRDFIGNTNLPFLPSPMGSKGCCFVPDSDLHSAASSCKAQNDAHRDKGY